MTADTDMFSIACSDFVYQSVKKLLCIPRLPSCIVNCMQSYCAHRFIFLFILLLFLFGSMQQTKLAA